MNAAWCRFTWRLPGDSRIVQCRLAASHGGTFHRCGVFVTSTAHEGKRI